MSITNKTNQPQQFNLLAGSTNRMAQVDSSGLLSATQDIVNGKITDNAVITLLTTDGNWNKTTGAYTGTTITGTSEGQYYADVNYYFTAYGDNSWVRLRKNPVLPSLTFDKMWIGDASNNAVEADTAVSALFVGDYTNDYPALITASNWTNNISNAITGVLGDRAIGIDELGSISESFYTQYGWARDFIDAFITDATLIAALQTNSNWTPVSDVLSTYNAAKGDRNQLYYANGVYYMCFGTASHTWLRFGNLPSVVVSDPTYITTPQILVGKVDTDTIVIPGKYDITAITVQAETTTVGNISIGSTSGGTDIVASTALPIVVGQKKQLLYVVDPNYPTNSDRTMYINISSAASVQLTILTQKYFE